MSSNKKMLFLPGDGIGPEVMGQVRHVIEWMDKRRHVSFDVQEDLVGGAAYDKHGTSLADKTLDIAQNVDAVLLGAVGGPKWDNVARDSRPEAGLLKLRKEMDLFANLRPATVIPALAEASSLKTELVSGLDIMIVRELTAGIYFGEPRGISINVDGIREVVDTQRYTEVEIERVVRVAFDLAGKRNGKLTSVEKANVIGGEKLLPLQLGKVYIYVKPDTKYYPQRNFTDNILDVTLKDYFKQYSVVTIDPIVNNVSYLFYRPYIELKYSADKAPDEDTVKDGLVTYMNTNESDFGSYFEESKFRDEVDNFDPLINSVIFHSEKFIVLKKIVLRFKSFYLSFN